MNLLKSPLRRVAAATAGAFLGLAGAVVSVSPANAHHPIVSVGTRCANADGSWEVTWHVKNSERDLEGKILEVVSEPNVPIEGIAPGVTLPLPRDGVVKGTQKLGADVRKSTLKVKGEWIRNGHHVVNDTFHRESVATVAKPKVKCAEQPSTPPTTTPPTEPTTPPTTPPATEPTTPPVTTPPATTPPASTPPADEPAEPSWIVEGDCTSMTIGADNPEDGIEFTLKLKTSKGEERTVTVAPGERKTEKFSASKGFKVTLTVTVEGESASETVAFQEPEDCEAGSGGGDGQLPVTGAAAGGIAAGAGALLAIGAVLFFMARRRKVKFTA